MKCAMGGWVGCGCDGQRAGVGGVGEGGGVGVGVDGWEWSVGGVWGGLLGVGVLVGVWGAWDARGGLRWAGVGMRGWGVGVVAEILVNLCVAGCDGTRWVGAGAQCMREGCVVPVGGTGVWVVVAWRGMHLSVLKKGRFIALHRKQNSHSCISHNGKKLRGCLHHVVTLIRLVMFVLSIGQVGFKNLH